MSYIPYQFLIVHKDDLPSIRLRSVSIIGQPIEHPNGRIVAISRADSLPFDPVEMDMLKPYIREIVWDSWNGEMSQWLMDNVWTKGE